MESVWFYVEFGVLFAENLKFTVLFCSRCFFCVKFYSILLTGLSGVGRSFILCGLVLVVFVAVLPGVLCLCLCFARFFIVVWRFDLEAVLRVRMCAISCFCG